MASSGIHIVVLVIFVGMQLRGFLRTFTAAHTSINNQGIPISLFLTSW